MLISGYHIVIRLVQSDLWLLPGYQWLLVVIRLVQSGFMVIVVITWLSVVLDCLSNVSIDSMHEYIIHSYKIVET